jgi:nucleotide-binding universal stress UspA family protein
MHGLERILVATDLEGGADSTAATAVFLARAFDSRLLLLHVAPEILKDTWNDEIGPEPLKALLHDLKARLERDGAPIDDVAVLTGKASYRICQYAEQKNANLIIIGASQARKSDVRLGVTASRVLRNSVKPVWVVREPEALPPTSILCPVDGSAAAHRALENAIRLCSQFQARLTVVTVREGMPEVYVRMMRPDDPFPAREMKRLRASTRRLVEQHDLTGVDLDIQVRDGSPHAEILSAAAECKCDLIVMGAEGMSNQPRALVGSVTEKVTRAMPCSMLIVCDEDFLASRLESVIEIIRDHMQEGESLLRTANPLVALAEFEQCLLEVPTYAPAWEAMAAAYEALGDLNKADRCREMAQRIRAAI